MIGDFFDDGFDAGDAALIGGLAGMIEEENEDEQKRKKLEEEMYGPYDSPSPSDEFEDDYPDDDLEDEYDRDEY